eukprot:Tamp_11653.p1 GENE.Tamp_11653~~Tamp_11653.p1  ORF type:complete len:323 (+),score=24.29 Tamp_11653:423-1391(+)
MPTGRTASGSSAPGTVTASAAIRKTTETTSSGASSANSDEPRRTASSDELRRTATGSRASSASASAASQASQASQSSRLILTGRAHVDWVQVQWSVWTMIEYDLPEITTVFKHGGVCGLATWIMEGVVDIWDAFPFVSFLLSVAGMITVAHYTGLGLVHVFLRNEGERINGTKLGCFCVVVAAAGGMGSQLLFYKSRPKQHRRRLALAASALYPIFICINVILNSSSGRSSPAALLDAALLSFVGSHCFLHRVFVRALANLLPCFSWHFCKRQFNSLTEARGSNLTHLLIASAIYIVSFIASCHFQARLSWKIDRKHARRAA